MSVKAKHLVVYISGHGYGHAAMTAPLVNAFHKRHPSTKITIKSGTPPAFLKRVLDIPFEYHVDSSDFGMVNKDAFEVDLSRSLERYQSLHKHWQPHIEELATQLRLLKSDYLLSNIAYAPLFAARQTGIPTVAFGCLNWAEIFHHYYGDNVSSRDIYEQMLEAYASAGCFIRTDPAMPMAELDTHLVGPIAGRGKNRRGQLLRSLGLPGNVRLALATMGGIKTDMNSENWPEIENLHYLVPDHAVPPRTDISTVSTATIGFTDLLCSVDVLFTKPGYGSFTEAACNQVRVLYAERLDWPEHPYLSNWLKQHTACQAISQQQLHQGDFADELSSLLRRNITTTAPPSGLPEALDLIEHQFQPG